MNYPPYEGRCPFCLIVKNEAPADIVYEDDHTIVLLPLAFAVEGQTLVVPKKHAPYLWSYEPGELAETMNVLVWASRAVKEAFGADGLNVIQSNGGAATQTVWHAHFHLVPRWHDDRMGWFWPHSSAREPWTRKEMADKVDHQMKVIAAERHRYRREKP